MIYTITPNPALDLSGHVHHLIPNEKNYVFDPRRDPGGNGINSARIAHRLKHHPVVALGFLGGSTGHEIEKLLKKEGVPTDFTPIQGNTRINVTANNHEDHRQTRLTFPGPKILRSECQALLKKIDHLKAPGILIISGSLPEGLPHDFYPTLARRAQNQGLGVIADVPAQCLNSLKPPLLMIKPNLAELEEWAGRRLKSDAQILNAASQLLNTPSKPGIATLICVSLAERGAFLLAPGRVWFAASPHVQARGTVGAGDSLVGAMAARLAQYKITTPEAVFKAPASALEDSLAWGVAAGAATAEALGTSLANPAEVRKLRGRVVTLQKQFTPRSQ
ncbi:1-phosphofructokinase family hexose kinase [Bdellovibrionota bacterium FG-2]